jgi:transcriptional regulator GlxA family with amidase domain
MTYVAGRRVERAKVMMTSTGDRLAAIATACGFVDQSHLNRSFRRRIGVSPGMWRRANVDPVSKNHFTGLPGPATRAFRIGDIAEFA